MKIMHSGMQPPSQAHPQDRLSNEQKEILAEILSGFDPENFSSQDRQSLRMEFQRAGIPSNREVAAILREKGFTVPAAPMKPAAARPYGRNPDHPLVTPQIISLFQQHKSGLISETEFHARLEQVRQQMTRSTGHLIETSV